MGETPLKIDDLRKDTEDLLVFTDPSSDVKQVINLSELPQYVDQTVIEFGGIWYVTGGFQGTYSHFHLLSNYENSLMPYNGAYLYTYPVLLGLESDEYIRRKGREPIIQIEDRIRFWTQCLRDHSRIFLIPPNTTDYDQLAKDVGVYRKKGVYHIGHKDDTTIVRDARIGRCCNPEFYLEINMWDQHTSDFK